MSVLDDPDIRDALRRAWQDSQPDELDAHEEGGFILQVAGSLVVDRWPRGAQNRVVVPDHLGGRRGGLLILATFHTHPNNGPGWLQGPSPQDVAAVGDDVDLSHPEYEGEYAISLSMVYRICKDGWVEAVGDPQTILSSP